MKALQAFLSRYSLVIGIILMFVFTWPIDLSNAGLMPFQVPFMLYLFLGWGFGLAAGLMTWVTLGWPAVVRLYKRYLIWRVGWKWYLALLMIPAVQVLSVFLAAAFTGSAPDFSNLMVDKVKPEGFSRLAFVIPFLLTDVIANGEEIGWRGYVLPRLQVRSTALTASMLTGLIWTVWHLPKLLNHWDWTYFAIFTVDTVMKSILLAWIYNGTGGSLLLVVLAHAAWNTMGIFLPSANTLSTEGLGAFVVQAALEIVIAFVIVRLAGAENLSRTQPRQAEPAR